MTLPPLPFLDLQAVNARFGLAFEGCLRIAELVADALRLAVAGAGP
jgi:hypothetical protein